MRPLLLLSALILTLTACGNGAVLGDRKDLGTFRLGHNVVVAQNVTQGPFSREATPEEFETLLTAEIDRRLGRYEGGKWFHLGVSVDGYILAIPGIPVVASPKSALVISVRVWDDALGRQLTDKPHQITVLESVSGGTLLGSGLTRSREEQLENLIQNAALAIERYLADNPEWFEGPETAEALAAQRPEPRP